MQKTSRPWGVSVHPAVQNSPLQPSVLVPWRASCRLPATEQGWWRDGAFSVVKTWVKDVCWRIFIVGEKMASNCMFTHDYTYDLNFKYVFRFFCCSPRIFFTNKNNNIDSICWFPWGEFGGHWPQGLVLIQSQMVPSNETWTALVDCLGKASCWQRALDHTSEGTFMAGTLGGGSMS